MAVRNTGIGAVSQDNQRDYPVTRSKIIKALQDLKDTKIFNALTSGQGLARQFQIDRQAPGSGLGTFQAGTTPGFYGAVSPTIESRPDKDSPLVSGTGIVSFDEAIDDPLQSMRELASLGLLQQSPTKATTTDDKSTTGTSTKSSKDKSATSTIDRKADLGVEEGSGLDEPDTAFDDLPTITDTTETDATSKEEQGLRKKESSVVSSYGKLLASAVEDFEKALGSDQAPKGARSIEEYKKDFTDATGIDISGEPDNRAALIALGTALMQNRAGKGFNVGSILSEVGKAGEKALPAFEAARKEAKANQVAAGKFALDAKQRDSQAKQDFLIQQRNFLTKTQQGLRLAAQQRIDTIQDNHEKYMAERDLAIIEANAEVEKERIEAQLEAIKADAEGREVKNDYQVTDPTTKLTYRKAFTDGGTRAVFADPVDTANLYSSAYQKMLRTNNTFDRIESLLTDIANSPAPTVEKFYERAVSALVGFGIKPEAVGAKFTAAGVSKESEINALIRVLLAENKRLATQETGNGISNVDVQGLKEAFGETSLIQNPQEALVSLREARNIFNTPFKSIQNVYSELQQRENFATDEAYERTQRRLEKDLNLIQAVEEYQTLDDADEEFFELIDVSS
jgi:hypothetical protein